jgi:hypothetical protein
MVTPKQGQEGHAFELNVRTKYAMGGITYDKMVKNNNLKRVGALLGKQSYNRLT